MRKTAIAASGFALAIALSACGDKGGDQAGGLVDSANNAVFGNAQELVQAASTKTESSKSAKFTMEMSMMGMAIKGNGEGRFEGENSAMSMTMDMMGQQMETRVVDRAVYIKTPAGVPGANAAKPWMKISADGSDPMSQQLGGSFDQMAEQGDPTKMLDYVKQAGTITKSEQGQLDGQDTTHYWIDLDFNKMLENAPGGIPPEQAKAMQGKIGTIPMELWLDSEQRPAQVVMDTSAITKAAMEEATKNLPPEAAGQMPQAGAGDGKVTMKYTDWGAEVNVQAPPADQVGEMPSMPGMGGMGG